MCGAAVFGRELLTDLAIFPIRPALSGAQLELLKAAFASELALPFHFWRGLFRASRQLGSMLSTEAIKRLSANRSALTPQDRAAAFSLGESRMTLRRENWSPTRASRWRGNLTHLSFFERFEVRNGDFDLSSADVAAPTALTIHKHHGHSLGKGLVGEFPG